MLLCTARVILERFVSAGGSLLVGPSPEAAQTFPDLVNVLQYQRLERQQQQQLQPSEQQETGGQAQEGVEAGGSDGGEGAAEEAGGESGGSGEGGTGGEGQGEPPAPVPAAAAPTVECTAAAQPTANGTALRRVATWGDASVAWPAVLPAAPDQGFTGYGLTCSPLASLGGAVAYEEAAAGQGEAGGGDEGQGAAEPTAVVLSYPLGSGRVVYLGLDWDSGLQVEEWGQLLEALAWQVGRDWPRLLGVVALVCHLLETGKPHLNSNYKGMPCCTRNVSIEGNAYSFTLSERLTCKP